MTIKLCASCEHHAAAHFRQADWCIKSKCACKKFASASVPRDVLLDLWLALGQTEESFEAWMAQEKAENDAAWKRLLGQVRGLHEAAVVSPEYAWVCPARDINGVRCGRIRHPAGANAHLHRNEYGDWSDSPREPVCINTAPDGSSCIKPYPHALKGTLETRLHATATGRIFRTFNSGSDWYEQHAPTEGL